MTIQELDELAVAVENVWPKDKLKVTMHESRGIVSVEVSQMYEHVPCAFKHLKALSELFGTEDFDVNNSHSSGCETCDYGSSYRQEFSFKLPTSKFK